MTTLDILNDMGMGMGIDLDGVAFNGHLHWFLGSVIFPRSNGTVTKPSSLVVYVVTVSSDKISAQFHVQAPSESRVERLRLKPLYG